MPANQTAKMFFHTQHPILLLKVRESYYPATGLWDLVSWQKKHHREQQLLNELYASTLNTDCVEIVSLVTS